MQVKDPLWLQNPGQKSKIGVFVGPLKGLMFSKIVFKKLLPVFTTNPFRYNFLVKTQIQKYCILNGIKHVPSEYFQTNLSCCLQRIFFFVFNFDLDAVSQSPSPPHPITVDDHPTEHV